jgi:hypothetical protein
MRHGVGGSWCGQSPACGEERSTADAVLMIAFVSGSGTTRAIAMATEGVLAGPDVGRVLCHPKDSRASALSA